MAGFGIKQRGKGEGRVVNGKEMGNGRVGLVECFGLWVCCSAVRDGWWVVCCVLLGVIT